MADITKTGLDLLREPFGANHISKLPKPTKKQTDDLKVAMDRKDFTLGIRCTLCGGWHHKDVIHLDYVGHAALTDRLLDVDPQWSWEPLAFHEGLPAFDHSGGLWIKLTVCGVTRLGYGHAAAKSGQDPGAREKEVIGDALRNAAMRFGAALDLWHKGDLHADPTTAGASPDDEPSEPEPRTTDKRSEQGRREASRAASAYNRHQAAISAAATLGDLKTAFDAAKGDKSLSTGEAENLISLKDRIKDKFSKPIVAPNFENMDTDIPFGERQPGEYLNA